MVFSFFFCNSNYFATNKTLDPGHACGIKESSGLALGTLVEYTRKAFSLVRRRRKASGFTKDGDLSNEVLLFS